jgi:SAM-dependent methyltransferase
VTGAATSLHPGGLELTDRLVATAGFRAGAAVLDVGCGAGATAAHLTDDLGLRVTGLDASRERIAQAAEARPDLALVAGRAEALPFADASFDAVVCECVLSTLDDPARALAEVVRVLRPGGAVLVSDVYTCAGTGARPGGATASLGPRETVEALFAGAGLRVTLWNDEPAALGRYLWDHAGACAGAPAPAPERRVPSPGGPRLGYLSCVAGHASPVEKGVSRG